MSMRNHQEQQEDQEPMDSHKNPNLETTHNHHHHHVLPPPSSSSQDFNMTHHQHNISKKTHEDEKFTFKNAYEVIKNPTFLSSSSSPAAGGGHAMPPRPPPPPPQDVDMTHHQHIISKKTQEDEKFTFKNAYEVIKNPNFLSSSSLVAGERHAMPPPPPPPPPQDFKKTNPQHNIHASLKINEKEGCFTIKNPNSLSCSLPVEESGRDRLTRHRVEMAGRVRIPDIWGHEDLLKDWIDCTVFDSSLGNKTIMSARAALVQERRSTLRIENQC
ncbi:hypothetical protein L1987_04240 [Smallanthus sonchifolius]|uniref:Uncharacterized protein n=1 Tax=Smallanthus sonchifolius TaxID=185202 RepID=A0ACB9KCX0_9ASTR|nr:hypothetical protein L1987_04240 [Smallanthus sonchifolius]